MTDDITHGLGLLADEVDPAAIDSHAVIAQARARTRNRRTMTAAFASVAAIGALTMTLSTDRTTDTNAAAGEEKPSQRLTAQLTAALPELIPAGWEIAPTPPTPPTATPRPPRTFGCNKETPPPADPELAIRPWGQNAIVIPPGEHDYCTATAWYQDSQGEILLQIGVDDGGTWFFEPCAAPECEEHVLPDGTRWRVSPNVGGYPINGAQQIESLRPDGTHVQVHVSWVNDRSTPPLTPAELMKYADVFDY